MEIEEQWPVVLKQAIKTFIDQTAAGRIEASHLAETPNRVARAFAEYVSGYYEDPEDHLKRSFEDSQEPYDEMVHVYRIPLVSMCAHHIAPIIGRVHFAYIPKGRLVGLSKIPRFISVLSRRLQIQEQLTQQIVNTFQKSVAPSGCAVAVRAYHCCMITRGVREHDEITLTTALRGCFKSDPVTRAEFLASLDKKESILA